MIELPEHLLAERLWETSRARSHGADPCTGLAGTSGSRGRAAGGLQHLGSQRESDRSWCAAILPTFQSTTGFNVPGSKTSRAGIQEQQAVAWGRWVQEFPRVAAVRKSTSVRSLLRGKMSYQLVNQRATADKGRFLATCYRAFFSATNRNSGSPTFTTRRLLQSILHTPPGR